MLRAFVQYGIAGLSYARRNRRYITLLSVAGIGAATAIIYARRQYQALTSALDEERNRGARSLRSVYRATRRTVESTLRALLIPGRERIFSCTHADSDLLVSRLRSDLVPAQKKEIWHSLQIAVFVRLVSSMYYVVVVYVILLLQVSLVARYSAIDEDAPIESLSGERLCLQSKQLFLSLSRRRLFEENGIENLVQVVRLAVEEVVGPLKLSEKVSKHDLRDILKRICLIVDRRGGIARVDDVRGGTIVQLSQELSKPEFLTPEWLLAVPGTGPDHDISEKVTFLVSEALDLCDVLQFGSLIQCSIDSLIDIASDLVDINVGNHPSREADCSIPLASLVPKISNVCQLIFGPEQQVEPAQELENPSFVLETHDVVDGPFVSALLQAAGCDAFGAGVFLSGEKERSIGAFQRDQTASLPRTVI